MAQSSAASEVDQASVSTFLDTMPKCFNFYANQYNLPFLLQVDPPHTIPKSVNREFNSKLVRVYSTTVETAVDALSRLVNTENVGLHGLTQSDKTTVQGFVALTYSAAWYAQTGQLCYPVILTPNKTEHVGQFERKHRCLFELMRFFKIKSLKSGKEVPIGDYGYFGDILPSEMKTKIDSYFKKRRGDTSRIMRSQTESITEEMMAGEKRMILPVTRKHQIALSTLADMARVEDVHIFYLRDESHFAMADGSVNDDMWGFIDNLVCHRSVYDDINGGNSRVMLTSATNFHLTHLSNVKVRIGNGYCGVNIGYDCNPHTDSFVRLPDFWDIHEEGRLTGCNLDINPSSYMSAAAGVKTKMVKNIAKWIVARLGHLNVKRKRGALIRLSNNNGEMNELISRLSSNPEIRQHGIRVIRYFDDEFKDVLQVLQDHDVEQDGLYVVVATGRARMGDSFPDHCGYGLDFTDRSCNIQSLLQGTFGRMTGYYKDPIITMSPKNCDMMRAYIKDPRSFEGTKLNGYTRARPKFDHGLEFQTRKADSVVKGILREVEEKIVKYRAADGTYPRHFGEGFPVDLFKILTPNKLAYLAKNARTLATTKQSCIPDDVRFLMPGEVDEKGYSYRMSGGKVVMTFRNETTKSKAGGRPSGTSGLWKALIRVSTKHILDDNNGLDDTTRPARLLGIRLYRYHYKAEDEMVNPIRCVGVAAKINNGEEGDEGKAMDGTRQGRITA